MVASGVGDEDRDAIVKRRNRLIALAFAGLTGATGCDDPAPEPCLSQVQFRETVPETVPETEPEAEPDTQAEPQVCLSVPLPEPPPEAVEPRDVVPERPEARPRPCLSIARPRPPEPVACLSVELHEEHE